VGLFGECMIKGALIAMVGLIEFRFFIDFFTVFFFIEY